MGLIVMLIRIIWHYVRSHHITGYETSNVFEAYCDTCKTVIGVEGKD